MLNVNEKGISISFSSNLLSVLGFKSPLLTQYATLRTTFFLNRPFLTFIFWWQRPKEFDIYTTQKSRSIRSDTALKKEVIGVSSHLETKSSSIWYLSSIIFAKT